MEYQKEYESAQRVHFHQRRFVNPEFGNIIVGDRTDPKGIPIRELIPEEERLKDIYEHDGEDFTGRFREGGKQKLADILGKEVAFWTRPGSAPITVGESEIYTPRE